MQLFSNNFEAHLVADISDSDTELFLDSVAGTPVVAFPEDYFTLTLCNGMNAPEINIEIVKCTAVDTGANSITIERGQEGTAAVAHVTGECASLRITAKAIEEKFDRSGGSLSGDIMLIGEGDVIPNVDFRRDDGLLLASLSAINESGNVTINIYDPDSGGNLVNQFAIRRDGNITVNGDNNKVWHRGNHGPDSGMNADLLDNHEGSDYYLLDGTNPLTADFQAGGFKLAAVADGTVATDAVNKGQLDLKLDATAKAVDSDKLDGIDSTQFVRSDTHGTLRGLLQFVSDNDYCSFAFSPNNIQRFRIGTNPDGMYISRRTETGDHHDNVLVIDYEEGNDSQPQLKSSGGKWTIANAQIYTDDYHPSQGDVDWGDIGGTLANQTDLQSALDGKVSTAGDSVLGNLAVYGSYSNCFTRITNIDKSPRVEFYIDELCRGGTFAAVNAVSFNGFKTDGTTYGSLEFNLADQAGYIFTEGGMLRHWTNAAQCQYRLRRGTSDADDAYLSTFSGYSVVGRFKDMQPLRTVNNFTPYNDNFRSLGESSKRWSQVYSVSLNIFGTEESGSTSGLPSIENVGVTKLVGDSVISPAIPELAEGGDVIYRPARYAINAGDVKLVDADLVDAANNVDLSSLVALMINEIKQIKLTINDMQNP